MVADETIFLIDHHYNTELSALHALCTLFFFLIAGLEFMKRVFCKIEDSIVARFSRCRMGSLKGTIFRQMWNRDRDQMSRCCICFEDYTGDKDEIVLAIVKKCGHYFHYECVCFL